MSVIESISNCRLYEDNLDNHEFTCQMKLKSKVSLFGTILQILLFAIFWLLIQVVVQKVIFKNIEQTIIEKRDQFKIDMKTDQDVKAFLNTSGKDEIFANFSNLRSEFVQLYRSKSHIKKRDYFADEDRSIDNHQATYRVLYHRLTYKNKMYVLEIGESVEQVDDLTQQLHLYLLLFMLGALLISHFAQSYLFDYLLRPFQKIITNKINNIDEPESFDFSKINSTSTDFVKLDEGLNLMMSRIQEHFKREKQFIANVSHELLTPISVLKNRLENLLNNPSLNDEAVDKIDMSLKNLDTLRRIINNLLLISRIENNQYSNFEPVDFKVLILEILEDLEGRFEEKQITVINSIDELFQFDGNTALLHTMFYNLIYNATKFTPNNGFIEIADGFRDDRYYISIIDSGIGMTKEQTAKIFERFVQIDMEREGQGLGLAIVSSIAVLHKIDISVRSEVNVGTTFTLNFTL